MSRPQAHTAETPLPQAYFAFDAPHPDHHLWKNGRVWWAAFTVQGPEGRTERIRTSLRTTEKSEARRRRDELLARASRLPGWRLALRFAPRSGVDSPGAAGRERRLAMAGPD